MATLLSLHSMADEDTALFAWEGKKSRKQHQIAFDFSNN